CLIPGLNFRPYGKLPNGVRYRSAVRAGNRRGADERKFVRFPIIAGVIPLQIHRDLSSFFVSLERRAPLRIDCIERAAAFAIDRNNCAIEIAVQGNGAFGGKLALFASLAFLGLIPDSFGSLPGLGFVPSFFGSFPGFGFIPGYFGSLPGFGLVPSFFCDLA